MTRAEALDADADADADAETPNAGRPEKRAPGPAYLRNTLKGILLWPDRLGALDAASRVSRSRLEMRL
jgi:hypothetical protein